MRVTFLHRVFLVLVPALITGTVVTSTIWGDHGLLARHQLQRELREAQVDLAEVERENQRLLRELHLMDRDPVVLERLVADELRWGRPGDVIYDFGSASAGSVTDSPREPTPSEP